MATFQAGFPGGHGGRSVDITQTGTLTSGIAQVGDVKQSAAAPPPTVTPAAFLFGT
jgi:hypothetical protein